MNTINRFYSFFTGVSALVALCAFIPKAVAQDFLTNGLVAYFPFNGNANDETGNGYNGVSHGAVLTQDRFSVPNRAYLFNGTNNYIQVNKLLPDMTNLTISAWVQYSSGSYMNGYGCILDDSDTTASNDFEFGVRDSTDAIIVATKAGYSLTQNAPLGRSISNVWVQVVWVITGSGSVVYLDGASVFTTTQGGNNTGLHALPVIGATSSQIPFVAFFGGKIDDLRIYHRALSGTEVQQLYLFEAPPVISIKKAVYVDSQNLKVGTNYVLQVSSDLNNWTNYGSGFTATNANWRSTTYWDVDDFSQLFFRLQIAP